MQKFSNTHFNNIKKVNIEYRFAVLGSPYNMIFKIVNRMIKRFEIHNNSFEICETGTKQRQEGKRTREPSNTGGSERSKARRAAREAARRAARRSDSTPTTGGERTGRGGRTPKKDQRPTPEKPRERPTPTRHQDPERKRHPPEAGTAGTGTGAERTQRPDNKHARKQEHPEQTEPREEKEETTNTPQKKEQKKKKHNEVYFFFFFVYMTIFYFL